MHIDVKMPYAKDWDYGCLTYRKKQDRMYVVFSRKKDRKTTSTAYARYLMAVKMGRYLGRDETVDHIDNNRLNDSIDNLQILSNSENCKKEHAYRDNPLRHGTSTMYRRGCRCYSCMEYKRITQKRYLERHGNERNARRRAKYKKEAA